MVLILNVGSSSVKYVLLSAKTEEFIATGAVEGIGSEGTIHVYTTKGKKIKNPISIKDHKEAVDSILNTLTSAENGVIKDKKEIIAVGHRIVHGGEYFTEPVILTEDVKEKIKKCFDLAPLHNPHHYKGIIAVEEVMPNVPQVVVFDTAFHQTLPEYAYLYGLPYRFYKNYNIRRYGFHGTSHQYIMQRVSEIENKSPKEIKIISCHLGNGASICAINEGKSVDTSMGLTPLEGLIMGSRCGDIDPYIVLHIMAKESLSPSDVQSLMNKQSGLLGITGISSDMKIIIDKAKEGNEKAKLAIEMFAYRVKKYISAYIGVLNGCDYIVFTAGIGERSPLIRKKILENMENLGIEIDITANEKSISCIADISAKTSKIKILVIPTNEELLIARQTLKLVKTKN